MANNQGYKLPSGQRVSVMPLETDKNQRPRHGYKRVLAPIGAADRKMRQRGTRAHVITVKESNLTPVGSFAG